MVKCIISHSKRKKNLSMLFLHLLFSSMFCFVNYWWFMIGTITAGSYFILKLVYFSEVLINVFHHRFFLTLLIPFITMKLRLCKCSHLYSPLILCFYLIIIFVWWECLFFRCFNLIHYGFIWSSSICGFICILLWNLSRLLCYGPRLSINFGFYYENFAQFQTI